MKIWVTGIAGFLGSHLADKLMADGHEVEGNDNLLCGDRKNTAAPFSYTDCRDFDGMLRDFRIFEPDVVVHCAATAHEGLSSFSPSFITSNIYEASVSVFSAAIASGAKRIVYMSSMSRYGKQQCPFTEDMQPSPVDPYGIAKVAAEETLKVLGKTHNVSWSIAVPHNIIGVRQRYVDPYRNVASIMINRCKHGNAPIIYGDGSQVRCFSPVADCIQSIIKMVYGEADGEIVNIGPDSGNMTILELAEFISNETNCHRDFIYVDGRPNEVHEAYCSSEKARELLDYHSRQSVQECLREMINNIEPAEFIYDFPIEIEDGCPKTWTERLM